MVLSESRLPSSRLLRRVHAKKQGRACTMPRSGLPWRRRDFEQPLFGRVEVFRSLEKVFFSFLFFSSSSIKAGAFLREKRIHRRMPILLTVLLPARAAMVQALLKFAHF